MQNQHHLNLNLGQTWITTTPKGGDDDDIDKPATSPLWWSPAFDEWFMQFLRWLLPDHWFRLILIHFGWKMLFLPLHRRWFGRSTGLHPSVSLECHALSTVMFLGHFVLHSVARIRYGLSIVPAARPQLPCTPVQNPHGLWVAAPHNNNNNTIIVWIHAGAYLSGSPEGNVGVAHVLATMTKCDVFLPRYRLAPEHTMADIWQDVQAALQWLLSQQQDHPKTKIILAGWSAGAALAMRLLQTTPNAPIVAGVLCSPFCHYDYATPGSSMWEYAQHDWLVTRGIQRVSLECLDPDRFWGGDATPYSPLHQPISSSLPPLCVVVSEHEAVYDETCVLVNQARAAGVAVTVGQWRYMPHGWYM